MKPGSPYRPSNGSEGDEFDYFWCSHCIHDAEFRVDMDSGRGCKIIADTFVFYPGDPNYPKEWIYGANGRPLCTAFREDETNPRRCIDTPNLPLRERGT